MKKAHVNLAVVDEAVFSIEEYNVDTLSELYSEVEDGVKNSFATHDAYISAIRSRAMELPPAEARIIQKRTARLTEERQRMNRSAQQIEQMLFRKTTARAPTGFARDSGIRLNS